MATPPRPNTTSGPNTGSCTTPTMVSTPPASIGWTSTRRRPGAERCGQLRVRVGDLGAGAQVQLDRARVGLVHQARHLGLQHHVAAQLGGRREHLQPGLSPVLVVDHRDPIAGQQRSRVGSGQPAAVRAGRQERGDQRARTGRRRYRRARAPAHAASHATPGTGPRARAPVPRSPGSCRRDTPRRCDRALTAWLRPRSHARSGHGQQAHGCRPGRAASPPAACPAAPIRIAALRSATAVGTPIASTASTPSSAATVSRQARNALTLTVADASTGPATAAPGGSSRGEPPLRRVLEGGDGQPGVTAGVGREHACTAGVGDDGDPAAGRQRLAGQERRRLDQLAEAVRRDDAGLAEQRLLRHQRRRRRRRYAKRPRAAPPRTGRR